VDSVVKRLKEFPYDRKIGSILLRKRQREQGKGLKGKLREDEKRYRSIQAHQGEERLLLGTEKGKLRGTRPYPMQLSHVGDPLSQSINGRAGLSSGTVTGVQRQSGKEKRRLQTRN